MVVATDGDVYDKIVSNIREVGARGAQVIAVATDGNEDIQHHADDVIYVPRTSRSLQAPLAVMPLQLLACRIARLPRPERRSAPEPGQDRHRRVALAPRASNPAGQRGATGAQWGRASMTALLRSPVVLLAAVIDGALRCDGRAPVRTSRPGADRWRSETVTSLGAPIAAVVVLGRPTLPDPRNQLALIISLVLLCAASVTVAAFVAIESAPRGVIVVAVAARLVGAWALAAAAFLPATPVSRPVRAAVVGTVGVAAIVADRVGLSCLRGGHGQRGASGSQLSGRRIRASSTISPVSTR